MVTVIYWVAIINYVIGAFFILKWVVLDKSPFEFGPRVNYGLTWLFIMTWPLWLLIALCWAAYLRLRK